jgi:hypothetical protein
MPSPWAGGAQVSIIGIIHGQETVNVMNFATNTQIQDPSSLDTELQALAQAVFDCVVSTLLPAITSDWKLLRVEAKRIAPTPSDPIFVSAAGTEVGQRGPICCSFITTVVHLRTGGGGRSGLGTIRLPPPASDDITASFVEDAVLVLLAQFLTCLAGKFLGSSPTTNWRLGVHSRKLNAATGGTFDNSFRIVTSLNPLQIAGHLASRAFGHGS